METVKKVQVSGVEVYGIGIETATAVASPGKRREYNGCFRAAKGDGGASQTGPGAEEIVGVKKRRERRRYFPPPSFFSYPPYGNLSRGRCLNYHWHRGKIGILLSPCRDLQPNLVYKPFGQGLLRHFSFLIARIERNFWQWNDCCGNKWSDFWGFVG